MTNTAQNEQNHSDGVSEGRDTATGCILDVSPHPLVINANCASPVRPGSVKGNGKPTMLPDYDMANRYLDALTGRNDGSVTFQFFDDKKINSSLATWRDLNRTHALSFLQKKQKMGCGVYAMVNRGNGKGRKAKNVVEVRALFIDLDGSPWEPVARMLPPHIRVESSSGRFHLYWLVSDCTREQFKALQQAIAIKFNGDKSCIDLCRVLRVPGFYHLKRQPVMTKLAEVNNISRYTTQEVIEGLGLGVDEQTTSITPARKQLVVPVPTSRGIYEYTVPHTGEVIDLVAWAAKNPEFDIVAALNPHYVRGAIKDGKQHIACPFENEHTEASPDLATFIANASPPKHKAFDIHCMHAHCFDRDRLGFFGAMLQNGWLSAEIFKAPAALQEKRVPKIYYPANEIASTLQTKTLTPDEFRIFLHLMHLSWAAENGTLLDDNWMIARSLGLKGPKWQEYRETLIRTGWLYELDGRLVSDVVKREFDNAQAAYDAHRVKSQKGGMSTQAKHSLSRA
jgi:RepB DNA-primase N-terminal domain